MRLPVWAWLALSSLLLSTLSSGSSPSPLRRHPDGRAFHRLDHAGPGGIETALSIPIAETLVRLSSHGEMEPVLAVAWQHDPDFKRWRFSLRPKVRSTMAKR